MDLAGISAWLVRFLINPLFWLILIVGFIVGVVGILWLRRKKRLVYPVIEMVDLGNGKAAYNSNLRAGWFGKKLWLKGLWWTGEENTLRTNNNDIIEDFSTEDYQEVNGERGIVCFRDPLRASILVPINKTKFLNKELVANIAPSDYTDTAIDIIKDASAETSDWKDKLLQFGAWALVVVFSLIAIIVIVQYVKAGQEKAAELLLQAGEKGAQACKDICGQAINIVASNSGAP